jgi:uncharacterized protein YndB with AHSA1/START domain
VRFRIVQRLAAPVNAVENAFVDPAFLAELGRRPELGSPELVRQEADDTGRVVRQWVAHRFTGELHATVRRVVDPRRLTWVEESTIDWASHRTVWRIVPDHYGSLLRCAGTFTLAPSGGGERTVRIAEGDIKVNMPLVGSKAEKAIVSGLEEHAQLQARVFDAWVAGP